MNAMGDIRKAFAGSVPFLKFFGVVAGRLAALPRREDRRREARGR